MRIGVPKRTKLRRPRAHFIDLRKSIDRAIHEERDPIRFSEAVELDALLERSDLALVAVWGEDQRGEAPLVEPLDEELPGVNIVFREVGDVVGGFFEVAVQHFLEDFGRGAEELFVDCVEFLLGAGVDAYDFGTELPG